MKITALSEGLFTVDRSKIFTAYKDGSDGGPSHGGPSHGVLVGVTPFLVSIGNAYILLDTGLGFEKNGDLQILQSLKKEGITDTHITHVVLSHLHKDHTGGCTVEGADGSRKLAFPNATYYVQKREMDFARQQSANPSYHQPTLELLAGHPQVVSLHEDHGQITEHVSYQVSSGHTPYHQTITIQEKDEIFFYGADELPQYGYLTNNFNYKNDFDGRKSMELRTHWQTQAETEHWTILFCHGKQRSVVKF